MNANPNEITRLLHEWRDGRSEALDQLMPVVYEQLRLLAGHQLRNEAPGHTLRATELVHELYLKLLGSEAAIQDRAHFYALASRIIRHMLTNHGAAKRTQKRGGGAVKEPLDRALEIGESPNDEVLEINQSLERLEALDPRKARLVEMTYFGGMDQDLAAEVLGVSARTVRRELLLAKAWLYNDLSSVEGHATGNGGRGVC